MGKAMRFCDRCEIAMGLMTRERYVKEYIQNPGLCPFCGKVARKENEEEEPWINLLGAYVRYNISMTKLRELVAQGQIRSRPGLRGDGGRMVPEKALVQYGKRMRS